jgi:hypothetical protein
MSRVSREVWLTVKSSEAADKFADQLRLEKHIAGGRLRADSYFNGGEFTVAIDPETMMARIVKLNDVA